MSLITWNFDKNFIYVLIYWILEISYRILLSLKRDLFKITKKTLHNEYIFVMLNNISDLLAGFLVLYTRCVTKSNKIKDETLRKQTQSELIYTKLVRIKKNFYIKFFIVVLLVYIGQSSLWISYAITKADPNKVSHSFKNNIKIALDIIMRYIFSVVILKVVGYKHRIFSMIIIGIGFILLITNDIILMIFGPDDSNIPLFLYYSAIASIGGITYPLTDTFVKQIFSEDYLYPANFQFYRGIGETILIAIITPILVFSLKINIEYNYDNFNIVIPSIILSTLASFIKTYITLKIIYHYSSQSVSFLRISQSFGGSIIRFIEILRNGMSDEWKITLIFLEIISILIILFASLIYDEIIIINVFRLNENVKLGIINRGEFDTKYMNFFRDSQLDNNQLVTNDNEIYSQVNEHDENNENNVNKE